MQTTLRNVITGLCCIMVLLLGRHMGVDAQQPASQLLESYECTRCHRLTTPHRLIGPSLWKIGERADTAFIRASILTPDTVIKPGYAAGLMRRRLQELGFYEDIKRQPAILERLVAYFSGTDLPSQAADLPSAMADMVHVQAGTGHLPNGQRVKIPAFIIDAAPVTTAQYGTFIAAGGYTTKRHWDRTGWAVVVRRRKRTRPLNWEAQQNRTRDQPVLGTSWYEADAYCRWAGKALPTEPQWQRACQEADGWYGPGEPTHTFWEWTAAAVWKGGIDKANNKLQRCAARVPSYPALDGRRTGFRCVAAANPGVP
ncbi:MAG: SUMF1/EgtB/PvdO family nonheme iron enzyme [Candidatus Tectomicrobia bacterium]